MGDQQRSSSNRERSTTKWVEIVTRMGKQLTGVTARYSLDRYENIGSKYLTVFTAD